MANLPNMNDWEIFFQLKQSSIVQDSFVRITAICRHNLELSLDMDTHGNLRSLSIATNITSFLRDLQPGSSFVKSRLASETTKEIGMSSAEMAVSGYPTHLPESKILPLDSCFPFTNIPLIYVLGNLMVVAVVATASELLYENKNVLNKNENSLMYANIPRPIGKPNPHKPQFHKEFLIPTAAFPEGSFKFFIENVKKKSDLAEIDIYSDFIFYQQKILRVLLLISSILIKFIFFTACSKFASIAVDSIVGDLNTKYMFLAAVLKIIISIATAQIASTYLKAVMRLVIGLLFALVVIVHQKIILVFQGITWVFTF